jgi:hypothetical protein
MAWADLSVAMATITRDNLGGTWQTGKDCINRAKFYIRESLWTICRMERAYKLDKTLGLSVDSRKE